MKLCGLTGGVGMGKSTAAGFFSRPDVRLVDTDDLARELVQPGQPALLEIRHQFGPEMISPAGELDRHRLARLVFADPAARKHLEDILHPRIRETWLKQVEQWRTQSCRLGIVVIPLLFETRAESHFDRIICVACSTATQTERLHARGWTPEQVRQRIAAQLPVEQKIARSHYVIWTEGDLDVHRRQAGQILEKL
jgi:dephospho-CoA kinase